MTAKERRILDAAINWVISHNKVPNPPNANDDETLRHDELDEAVIDYLGQRQWWAETYRPDGWPGQVQ